MGGVIGGVMGGVMGGVIGGVMGGVIGGVVEKYSSLGSYCHQMKNLSDCRISTYTHQLDVYSRKQLQLQEKQSASHYRSLDMK